MLFLWSKLPVGSSPIMMCESLINALTMAIRCFSPPYIWGDCFRANVSIPIIFNFSIALRSTSSSEYLPNFKPDNMRFCKTVNSSDSLVSSTKTFKKRRNVSLLTDFPLLKFHSALAVTKRCRCLFADAKIFSSSFLYLLLVYSHDLILYLNLKYLLICADLTNCLHLRLLMPIILPTSFEVRPSDFKSIVWQRFCKLWLLLFLNSISKKLRSWLEEVMERSVYGYTSKN